jgi:hypothetical protein
MKSKIERNAVLALSNIRNYAVSSAQAQNNLLSFVVNDGSRI